MDHGTFDRLTLRFGQLISRRAALGLGAVTFPSLVDAKKRRKHKKKKHKHQESTTKEVIFNAFGCVDVGKFCKNGGQCCSGICEGKKGKKKCKAHDAGVGCQAGDQDDGCAGTDVNCTTVTGRSGVCDTTTGNAGTCVVAVSCFSCRRDADCQAECGPAAVCIRCAFFCTETNGTACANPTSTLCPV